MENKINYCIVVPQEINLYVEERSDKWYDLYDVLLKIIKEKLYADRNADICSVQLYKEGDNIILAYKVVPATAPSMSAYPYYYALVIKETQIVRGE